MGGRLANRTLRGIETLYTSGPTGGLTDAQLVDRFLNRDGRDREDAFSGLVHRHGPLVLSVCRRAVPSAADADDAFQAVFLVLARNARSIRRVENLRPWLYGVAIRTAREARRRSARLRAREGTLPDDPPAAPASDPDLFELRALLDEELGRLPSRYRDPLLLCELEGASRQDAARRLGLPEGTLSTRLARGRVMLKNRLVRRGVTGAGLSAAASQPVRASVLEPLANAATRFALNFATPDPAAGAIPAAVASLAEGVLTVIAVARLKATLVAVSSLVVASCLTTGLAWGVLDRKADDPTPKAAADDVEKPRPESSPSPITAQGMVVDETGAPMAGAEVRIGAYRADELRVETTRDGAFAVPVAGRRLDGRSILVRAADGRKIGTFSYGYNLTNAQANAPARIVVKSGREVVVHVADANKTAIPNAAVEVVAGSAIVDHKTTGTDGVARVTVPADAKVDWITAQKGGTGFDFAEFGEIDPFGQSPGGVPVVAYPSDSVSLTLDDPQTVRIKAVDQDGKPVPGVDFYIWSLSKEGRRTGVNYPSRLHEAKTDADGIATFDWLPKSEHRLSIYPASEGYARRQIVVEPDQTEISVAHLARTETIRGRVVLPDGSPAADVLVRAFGSVQGLDLGYKTARTAADGSYTMDLGSNEAYAIYVDEEERAARSRLDVVVRRGEPVDRVDFQLGPGTLLKGTVTIDSNGRPEVGVEITIRESGEKAPDDLREEGDLHLHQVSRYLHATTDDQGRYQIRVGPGTYTMMGPPRTEDVEITVTDERELIHNFRMPRPEKGPLSGKVVRQSDGSAVAGASVDVASIASTLTDYNSPFTVRTDAEGRFQTERSLDKTLLWASSPDGSLGAIVEIGAETPEVVIPLAPTATATGVLLDEKGEIAANQPLKWGLRVYLDEDYIFHTEVFGTKKVVTDAQGRFTLPSLVVGQEYDIGVRMDRKLSAVGIVRPEKPGPLDLGTLRVGAYEKTPGKAK